MTERSVAIHPWLLEKLACPLCKADVVPTPDGSALLCQSCGRQYPIVEDVPMMLVEDASPVSEDQS